MKEIYLELPFPPTVNSYYSKTQRGIYISRKGREFRDMCADECHEQNAYGLLLFDRLQVDVILYPPDRRRRDLDNYMKALLDSLTQAKVWEDDEQVDNLIIHRGKIIPRGKCAVRLQLFESIIMPDSIDIWDFI